MDKKKMDKKKTKVDEKILKKFGVGKLNSDKLLKQYSRGNIRLVKEEPPRELIRDDRSLFFNDEYNKEIKRL